MDCSLFKPFSDHIIEKIRHQSKYVVFVDDNQAADCIVDYLAKENVYHRLEKVDVIKSTDTETSTNYDLIESRTQITVLEPITPMYEKPIKYEKPMKYEPIKFKGPIKLEEYKIRGI